MRSSRGNISIAAPGGALVDVLRDIARRHGAYTLDTQDVRVVGGSGGERDVVRWEDEICVACQNDFDDAYELVVSDDASPPVNPAKAPRCAAFRFTVDLDTTCSAIELRLKEDDPVGYPPAPPPPIVMLQLAEGRCWVALYAGDANKPTALIRVFDSWDAKRIPYIHHSALYFGFAPNVEEALVKATFYWIVISGGDLTDAAPPEEDQWRTEELRILKNVVAGTGHMVIDNAGKHRPEAWAGGEWTALPNADPFFRLYRRQFVLRNIPVQPGAVMPSLGERAVVEQVGGVHPSLQVTGARGGMTAAMGYVHSAGASGGGESGTGVSSDGPLEPGGVVYATGIGLIATDFPNFAWDAVNKRLGIGTNVIPHGGIGAAKFALEGPNASALGPHIQITTAAQDYPIFQFLGYQMGGVYMSFGAYWDGAWKRANAGSAYGIQHVADELRVVYVGAGVVGAAIALLQGPTLNIQGQWLLRDGTAAFPGLGFITEPGMGAYRLALNQLGLAAGGVLALTLTNTPQALVRDGVAANPGLGFGAEPALGIGRVGAGVLGFALGGAYQWGISATALYPIADNAETLGAAGVGIAGAYFSGANTTHPAAAGEARMTTAHRAMHHFIGGAEHYNGAWLFAGPVAADNHSGAGAHAETVFATSYPMPAGYLTGAKGLRINAFVHGSGGTAGADVILIFRVRLGGVGGTVLGYSAWSIGTTHRHHNVQFQIDLVAWSGAAAATIQSTTRQFRYSGADGDLNDRKAVDATEIMFRDADGQTVNLTTAKDIVVTFEVGGTSGGWSIDLCQLIVESIK